MTINQALNWAIKELKKVKINSAVLDAEVLLSFAIKKPKEWILTHPDYNLKTQEYKKLIKRRAKHEPVAYITRTKEFFGLNFFVDKNVLIPRPETELMVEKALEIIKGSKRNINLIDIGTGSGCIPISIIKNNVTVCYDRSKLLHSNFKIFAVDFSANALQIARKNAAKHKVKIKFLKGNLLKPLFSYSRELEIGNIIITANLPYLSDSQYKKLPPEIKKYEPRSTLVAGKDGLDYYKELLLSFQRKLESRNRNWIPGQARNDGWMRGNDIVLLLEIDPAQTKKIKKLIGKILPNAKTEIQKDLAKRDRLVIIKI
jgi:release factor glutamine methyltransferase